MTDQPSTKGLVDWFKTNFEPLDEDRNGTVTKREIEVGMLDSKLAKGNGAVYLSVMHDQVDLFAEAFGTEQKDAPQGITADGLSEYERAKKDQQFLDSKKDGLNLLGMIDDFVRIDRNNDGRIHLDEINKEIETAGWSAGQINRFELAKQHYASLLQSSKDGIGTSEWEKLSEDERQRKQALGITEEDLRAFVNPVAKAVSYINNSVGWFERRLRFATENPDKLVTQGLNNSCFFIAPLLRIQRDNPQAIRDMIVDNPDNTRTVTFPGDRDNPITVNAPTEAELATFADNRDAATIEKAFGIHWHKKEVAEAIRDKRTPPVEHPAPAARIQFGESHYPMYLLTGNASIAISPTSKSDDELHEYLEEIDRRGAPLVVGSRDDKENLRWGITPRHSYAAEYNPETRRVKLTNPLWIAGGSYEPTKLDRTPVDGMQDGVFEIGLQELKDRFFEVVTTKPTTGK